MKAGMEGNFLPLVGNDQQSEDAQVRAPLRSKALKAEPFVGKATLDVAGSTS